MSQTVITVDHVQSIGTPKTSAGARAIELDGVTVAALRDQRRAQLEERLLMGAGFIDRGFVFCLPGRSAVPPGEDIDRVRPAGREVGASADHTARAPPYMGNSRVAGRGASEGRAGATRALHHRRHAEHLLARVSRDAARRGGEGRGSHLRSVTALAVTAWSQKGHHRTTSDDTERTEECAKVLLRSPNQHRLTQPKTGEASVQVPPSTLEHPFGS